jgi:uncharacterized membrane protein YeaQ/YmgE (transglycosylase-associated protein family)
MNQPPSSLPNAKAADGAVFLSVDWRDEMNFIIWIVVGGLLGWVASVIMKTDEQQGIVLNVAVGVVGALIGGWLLAPLFGTGTINQSDFSLGALVVSLLGAVIVLAVVNLVRKGIPR